MSKTWGIAVAVAMIAILPASAAEAAEVGAIRAHFVYEETGRLSGNILEPDFVAWNSIIGEGSAEENANDLLVLVEVVGGGGEENIAGSLEIVARGEGGRILGRRRIGDTMLTSAQGRVWKALWLPDSACAGAVEIVASLGQSRRQAAVDLNCGE